MALLLNLAIIGLVALIAYWWANQGLLSALLHMICVIAAGAIAFAVWEPATIAILNGGAFDNYAWGVVLVGSFAVSLFVLRVIADRLAPGAAQLPQWANLGFGGMLGAVAGVLTVGICLIGTGFIQSHSEIMGYRGFGRDANTQASIGPVGTPMYLPVATLTAQFYGFLSVGSFHPDISGGPLREYNPEVDRLACLVRDSFENGKGQLALSPDSATVTKVQQGNGIVAVQLKLRAQAMDFGGQLTLSSSQVRLIGWPKSGEDPDIYYPVAWQQETMQGNGLYRFDDISHYASSVPGRKDADITLAFETPDDFRPRFLQVRGTRLTTPDVEQVDIPAYLVQLVRGQDLTPEQILAARPPAGYPLDNVIGITPKIGRLNLSANGLPTSMDVKENWLISGTLIVPWRGGTVSQGLRIKGVYADPDTFIVQIAINRESPASIFELVSAVGGDASMYLVDTDGNKYPPIGYWMDEGTGKVRIVLSPESPIRSIGELPPLATSGGKNMSLIFQITEAVTLREFLLGDVIVGTCDIKVAGRRRN